VPWWSWIEDRIESVPDRLYNLILVLISLAVLGAVFLPKAAKVATIAWVVSP